MVGDHGKADDELKKAPESSNIKLPEKLDVTDQAIYDRLSKLDGAAFDKAYARDMVKDHRADLAEFQQEARNGKDEQIKNFHLKMAREMIESVTGGTSTGSPSGSSR